MSDEKIKKLRKNKIAVLVPALYENEVHVIDETLKCITEELVNWEDKKIVVVYNGKIPDFAKNIEGIDYYYLKSSTSKTENLQYGLKVLEEYNPDFVALFDADSRPSKNSIDLLCSHIEGKNVCAQGSSVINPLKEDDIFVFKFFEFMNSDRTWNFKEMFRYYNTKSTKKRFLKTIVHSVYSFNHYIERQVYIPMMDILGFTFFLGSGAVWKFSVLKQLGFRKHLTEDLELSLRALDAGYNIKSVRDAVSYESSPETLYSVYQQRQRWTKGNLQLLPKVKGIINFLTIGGGILVSPIVELVYLMSSSLSFWLPCFLCFGLFYFEKRYPENKDKLTKIAFAKVTYLDIVGIILYPLIVFIKVFCIIVSFTTDTVNWTVTGRENPT